MFELALQVGEVAVESAVLRLQFGELGVLQALRQTGELSMEANGWMDGIYKAVTSL